MSIICKGFVPPNIQKYTAWAMTIFAERIAQRNSRSNSPTSLCPDNVLEASPPDKPSYCLLRFVNMKKQNSDPYPSKTVHHIMAALQHHMLKLLSFSITLILLFVIFTVLVILFIKTYIAKGLG